MKTMGNIFDSEEEAAAPLPSGKIIEKINPTKQSVPGDSRILIRTEGDGKESDEEAEVKTHTKLPPIHHATKHRIIHKDVTLHVQTTQEPQFVPYEPYRCAMSKLERSSKGKSPKPEPKPVIIKKATSQSMSPASSLQGENEMLRKELNLQVDVNSELKRLLVASVGEDVEARVAFLTQDKAMLANHLRWYAEQLTNNGEESEQLKIQEDIWRSKFKASSLLVSELAQSRICMLDKIQESYQVIRMLMEERNDMQRDLSCAHSHLCFGVSSCDVGYSLPHLSSNIHKMALNLHGGKCGKDWAGQLTVGEKAAQKLLEGGCSLTSSDLCQCGSGHHLGPVETAFQCCKHCSGEIHVV